MTLMVNAMRTTAVLLSLAVAHVASARAAPPTRDVLAFPAVERTLPNGLRVIVVPTGFPDLVSVQISMQTGSRNEIEPGRSGFAHFFEHMMFRGTKRFPPDEYQAILTRAGARQNAYTGATGGITAAHLRAHPVASLASIGRRAETYPSISVRSGNGMLGAYRIRSSRWGGKGGEP